MSDNLLVQGSSAPSGSIRSNVFAKAEVQDFSVLSPSTWVGENAKNKVSLDGGQSIALSDSALAFVKRGQAEGIEYSVMKDGKSYNLPKL